MKPGLAVLPLEVWADIFISPYQWINRQELAQILDVTSNRCIANKLDKLLHDCGRPTLGELTISSKLKEMEDREISERHATLVVEGSWDDKECKFPECDLPENIKGFKQITIRFLDDQVLDFLDKLKPLFTNVLLRVHDNSAAVYTLLAHLLPKLSGIRQISCSIGCFQIMDQSFPGKLKQVKELSLCADNASTPALLTWLSAPLNFDVHGPRFLRASAGGNEGFAVVDAVRQHFLSATTPSTFVIFIQFEGPHNSIDQFKLELQNAATNEELTAQKAWLYDTRGRYHYYLEILRHPVGGEAKVREWIAKRAYFDESIGEEQEIWILWKPKIGRITRKANAMMDEEESADNEGNKAAGPSTKK